MTYIPNLLRGTQDSGTVKSVPVTAEGHVEVAIHGPRLPFGSLHSEKLTPIFQSDAVYGLNSTEVVATTGFSAGAGPTSGTNTGTSNLFKCSTGTTQYSFATIQSRKRLRYRAGQGLVGRFAGYFTGAVANSILVAGFGHSESGVFFGFNGTSFGILTSTGGVRAVHTLTVTTASTATNNYNVVLNGATAVNVTATNNGSTVATAYEISRGTYPGWKAFQRGSTVIFLADSVGARGGSYTLTQTGAGTPAAGTYATTTAGVAATDTWVAQANWNGDKCDGSGPSGYTIDPTKGNVYEIGIQYLGFGAISFKVEAVSAGNNNAEWITCHTIKFPNTSTSVSQSNPSFPFTMAAYSAGSTTDCSVSIGSFAGFIEGEKKLTGPRLTYFNTTAVTSSTSAYTPIFTVRNDLTYASRANQAVINLLSASGATKSTTGLTSFFLIRNATLSAGVPNFASYATVSCSYTDVAATACTFTTNDQVIWSATVAQDGQFIFAFSDEVTLQPGETVTLAVRSVTATATCVGQLNTREDQ
jgi:hypothetical protein